ncbi:hypothetical protein EDD16DRAFT_1718510 [Pisolithus croceorrhizus]|nr:hypothetical protein EV401DRAFT_2082664 [Pisolithus croceorrhizus]KAI6098422.1 hypothetical protein EDD16DRAFT_1718510 [Pisolithus croceorrhizus]KAI6167880.1 hypothetical protein EDD17DRAFT_1750421 [Pisolithus thermaeus]
MAPTSHPTHVSPEAWSIMCQFAQDPDMTLPTAETKLQELLKDQFVYEHWQGALDAVMGAKGDVTQVIEAGERLATATLCCTGLTIKLPTSSHPPQLTFLEKALMESIQILKLQKRILRPLPTLDEIFDPKEEQEIGELQYQFEGRDVEIVAVVQHELAVKQGEVVEILSDDEDEEILATLSTTDLIQMCKTLEVACMAASDVDSTPDLARSLHKFHVPN